MQIERAKKIFEEKVWEHIPENRPTLKFSKPVKKFRSCAYYKRLTHEIALQPYYVSCNSEKLVKNTILHEIAHAMNPNEGHTKRWKDCFIRIGGSGSRYALGKIKKPK